MGSSDTELSKLSQPFINGESQQVTDSERTELTDPSTAEIIGFVEGGGMDTVDSAVQNSHAAAKEWYALAGAERGRILTDVAEALREQKSHLAPLEARDAGKPVSSAEGDVESLARYFEYYAGVTDKIDGISVPAGDDYLGYTRREPFGVTGHILPWNFPLLLFGRSVAPSIAAGNAAVVKPARRTPRTAVETARIAVDAGLPPGVINIVPGRGSVVGSALAGHEDIGCVSFTGSGPTGIEVGTAAIENVNPVHLELGGNGPNVVYSDADFENAVDNALVAIFSNAGQVCSAGPRLLVDEDVHTEFVDELVNRAESMTVGPVMEDPEMGPLISESHFEKVLDYIEMARKEVGDPVVGGNSLDRPGYFLEPTIFDDVPNDTRIAQEEVFGPVLTVTPFEDETEALRLANDTKYGLTAGVFTENMGRAHRFARDVEAGVVYINEWFAPGVGSPFGGYKQSGIGREAGMEAIHGYTQTKAVTGAIGG